MVLQRLWFSFILCVATHGPVWKRWIHLVGSVVANYAQPIRPICLVTALQGPCAPILPLNPRSNKKQWKNDEEKVEYLFLLFLLCSHFHLSRKGRFSEENTIIQTDQLTVARTWIISHCGSQSYSRTELLQCPCTLIMMIFSWLLLVLYCRSVTPWADHWFHYKARAVLGTDHHSTSVFFGSIGMLWRPLLVLS